MKAAALGTVMPCQAPDTTRSSYADGTAAKHIRAEHARQSIGIQLSPQPGAAPREACHRQIKATPPEVDRAAFADAEQPPLAVPARDAGR